MIISKRSTRDQALDHWSDLDFLFGIENFGFCALMKAFFPCIAKATELKNDKMRVLNANLQVKEKV